MSATGKFHIAKLIAGGDESSPAPDEHRPGGREAGR